MKAIASLPPARFRMRQLELHSGQAASGFLSPGRLAHLPSFAGSRSGRLAVLESNQARKNPGRKIPLSAFAGNADSGYRFRPPSGGQDYPGYCCPILILFRKTFVKHKVLFNRRNLHPRQIKKMILH